MKKNLLLWKILLMVFFNLLAINSFAQVANYTFSQSSGTYTALPTSTTLFTTAWDDNVGSVTIPFTYKFNGVGYTAASVNSNGYITFGTTPSGSTNYIAISSITAYDGAIAAFSRDLINNTSTIVYGTEGVTPNRVFVIQWNNARRYNVGGLADVMNFQIRLYETSNKAEIRYGSNSTSETANTSKGQVGLRGADNTDFNNRNAATNNTAWASLTAGTLNNDNVNYKSTVVPASSLTFTWTPPLPCSGTPTGGTVGVSPISGAPGSTYGVTATGYTTTGSGLTYQWQYSDTGGAPWTNQGTATSSYAALTGMIAPAFGTVRTWKLVVTCTASAKSADSTTGTFTSTYCTPSMTTPSASGDYIANVTFAGINNTTGDTASDYTYYNPTPSASVNAGSAYPISLMAGGTSSTYAQQFGVWIDYNHNGVFSDTGEFVFATTVATFSPTTSTGSITIPALSASVLAGTTRMRIGSNYSTAVSSGDYCTGASTYGEYEDYNIDISAALPCPTFSSTISIGGATTTAGSLYPSLTAAVADLSKCSISQPTTLSLNSSYNSTAETFPIVIPSISGSSTLNTLTIKPAVGVSPTISGVAPTSNALIKIYNSNTIIDGSNTPAGTTKNLSITNTNTGNSWITAIVSTGTTPITNVTLKNTNLTNGNQGSLGVIISDGTIASAGYFNNITIQNNSIQKASYGLYINGNTAVGNGSGLLITGNAFNGTGTNSVLNGIVIYGVDGSSTVSNNTINAANSLYNINSTGIILGAGANNVTISGNTISGVVNTVSSTYVATGILVNTGISAGTIQINNNNISGISSLGGYVDGAAGIDIGGATPNVNIYNNKISNIKNNNTGAWGSAAIFLGSSSTAANTLLYNNMIWDVAAYGYTSNSIYNGSGIVIYSGAGYKIYYNSVNMTTNQTTGIGSALYVYSSISAANAIDLRNNIFANNQTTNTRYAINSDAAKTVFSNIDYNDYYSTGSLGYLGSARATLANWQTATGKDVNSLNITPPFISSADLHLTGCSLLESAATPIAGITTDIDADLRSTNPDIGADESKMYFTGANLTTPSLWNVNNNWSSKTLPTSDKCVNIPSGKTAVVNITTAVAKKVTVDAGGYLTISPNQALTVTDVFTNSNVPNLVAASSPKQYYVTIENDGNLLQTNKVTNVGAIAARREINIRDHNQYNYAVSPLLNTNLNTNIYEDQTSHNLSNAPFTLYHNEATNKFYTSSGAYIAGRGLAVKEPATGTGKINMLFTGVPVNGSVPYTLVNSTPLDAVHGYNLIGNPYPSNLDLITFYNENNTTGKLDPTFYFWDSTANSQTSQAGSGYGGEAYAKFNVSTPPGVGTPTIATGDAGFAGTKSATRYVKVGQAFMARTTAGSLAVSFENTQRAGNSATGFFGKGAQEAAPFDRYWLNMISPANIISELAVVYFEGGNDAYTQDDSRSLLGSDAVYSIVEGQPIAINGKNSFAQTDVVPLGTKHFANGNYTIALKDQKDGVFANGQSIYLKDKQSGIITNLSEGNYTFAAIAGENTGRFEIIYQPEIVLATDGIDKEQIIVYRENNDFIIKSPKEMERVEVYDPSGKLIKVLLPNSKSAVIESTTLINGMYILKIELKDGEQYMKKIRK